MKTSWTLMLIAAIILLVLIFQLIGGGFDLILIIAFVIFSLGSGITRYLAIR